MNTTVEHHVLGPRGRAFMERRVARPGIRTFSTPHRLAVSHHEPEDMRAGPLNGTTPVGAAGGTLTIRVRCARNWWQRARGLIAHPPPLPGRGMYFEGTAAVHGIGMAHALDVVFLDAGHRVLRCTRLPRLGMRSCLKARAVLELRAGEIARLGVVPGMSLTLLDDDDIFGVQS